VPRVWRRQAGEAHWSRTGSHWGIYAVGFTNSADFPAIDPLQKSLRGTSDLFLTRLELPAMKMIFSTTFGGSGEDSGWGIAVDRRGNPVVGGITNSLDLPGTAGSYQPTNHGHTDVFVASFQLRHGRRIRTTYFGGSSDDLVDGQRLIVSGLEPLQGTVRRPFPTVD